MMKRITALALALAFLLSLSTAFAWSCPGCGSSMEGKFCTECGVKKPANVCPSCGTDFGDNTPKFCTECGAKLGAASAAEAPTASPAPEKYIPRIQEIIQNENGTVTVRWNADGETECSIEYFPKRTSNAEADFAQETGFSGGYSYDTTGQFTLSRLVPGVEYWIGVFDGDSNGGYVAYMPQGEPQPFTAFSNMMYGWCVLRKGEKEDTSVQSFTPADFADDNLKCGVHLAMLYNNPGQASKTVLQMVLEAPNGAKKVYHAVYYTFDAEKEDIAGWSFVSLEDYFSLLNAHFGEVPLGDHILSVYLDGEKLGSLTIPVTEKRVETTAAATAVPKTDEVTITGLVPDGKGSLTVSWTGGEAPYALYYMTRKSDDFFADREAARSIGFYWMDKSDIQATSYTITHLVPGRDYWIVVMDANEKGYYVPYTTEAAETFDDFEITLEASPRSRTGEEREDIPCIPANVAGVEDDTEYGAYLYLHYNNPGAARDTLYQLVVTLPNGEVCVDNVTTAPLASGEDKWLGWQFYSLEWLLKRVRTAVGSLPEGDVTVQAYLDGKLAGTATLPMKTLGAPEIVRVNSQGDGSHRLVWKRSESGPFRVDYFEHWSDDPEADKKDPRSCWWTDAQDLVGGSRVLEYLVPGKSYWLVLIDSNGMQDAVIYDVPVADSNLPVTVTSYPRREDNGTYTDLTTFSAAALNQDYSGSYGLYLDLAYANPSQQIEKRSMWVMTLPNGVSFVEGLVDLPFFTGGSTYWECYKLDWPISKIKEWYGEVLQGEYRLDLYVEGDYAGGTTFTVGK